jgi:hypothetical protein
MQNIDLAFISEQEEILKVLYESKNQGSVVGISASILGNGIFLTGVDNIIEANDNFIIVLKGYDVTGYILERNKIRLTDIRSVCPFKSKFTNPYLKEFTDEHVYRSM